MTDELAVNATYDEGGNAVRRIYKWPLAPGASVPWSPDDRVLLVADQGGEWPVLWAEQEDAKAESQRRFVIAGTGHPAPTSCEHIGSAVCGEFVWHVYAEPVEMLPF